MWAELEARGELGPGPGGIGGGIGRGAEDGAGTEDRRDVPVSKNCGACDAAELRRVVDAPPSNDR